MLFIFLAYTCYGEVTAWLENNPVTVGEMFRLNVEATNIDGADEPDLSKIDGLQIINRSTQNQTSIVGNKITHSIKWSYVLLASTIGDYQIPSLKIGNKKTNSILLKVIESSQKHKNKIVHLDLNVSPKKVYPQQQVLIHLRIIRNGFQLVNESITPFELEGTQIEKIQERSYQNVKNGIKQLITEIIYVLIPEKSGDLILPQIRYQGDEINGINLGGIFQKFGSYSQNKGRRIFSKTKPQSIEVLSIPKGFKGWWLPANNIKVNEKWQPNTPEFRVGVPVTRTISIYANGVYGDQIPELKNELPENLKGYVDQPQINTEKNNDGLIGRRTEKWAIIPSKPGKIVLPEISINWWDVIRDELRNTILPARIIEILPASNVVPKGSIKLENKIETNNNIVSVQKKHDVEKIYYWKVFSIFLAMLWLLTLFSLYLIIKNKKITLNKIKDNNKQNIKLSTKKARSILKESLNSGTPISIQNALLNWSKCIWENDPPKNIEQIGERAPELNNGIKSLNNALYGKYKKDNLLSILRSEFGDFIILKNKIDVKKQSNLAELYPDSR